MISFRMLAFRGAGDEPPKGRGLLGGSSVPLIPQESRTLHYNQPVSNMLLFLSFKSNNLLEKSL
ncbi:hypothetical protein NCCP28_42760 [Niallia sp. NCCP-28]|nr:hypothetical protein NCCP28_42760 [Niallia sp. NCCP-28]